MTVLPLIQLRGRTGMAGIMTRIIPDGLTGYGG